MSTDPQFPDRPEHPDFLRMSEVIVKLDAAADAGSPLEWLVDADLGSLIYMADQRAIRNLGWKKWMLTSPTLRTAILALYLDAFALGVEFQKVGGHRPNEAGNTGEKEGSS